MNSWSFKNVTDKPFVYKSYLIYEQDLALNNPQGLVGHKA